MASLVHDGRSNRFVTSCHARMRLFLHCVTAALGFVIGLPAPRCECIRSGSGVDNLDDPDDDDDAVVS